MSFVEPNTQNFSYSSNINTREQLTLLNSRKEHENDKYLSSIETNKRYKKRIAELEDMIREINRKSQISIGIMDSKSGKLTEEYSEIQTELEKTPSEEFMLKEISIIKNYTKKDPVFIARNMDNRIFVQNELMFDNETREALVKRIDRLMLLYSTKYMGIFDFRVDTKYNDHRPENEIERLIRILAASMRKASLQFIQQETKLKREIAELSEIIKEIEARQQTPE